MYRTRKNAGRHKRFYFLLGILLALIFLRYAFFIGIPRAVFVAVIVCTALFADKNELLALYVCCIPLHESIDLFFSLAFISMIYVFKLFKEIRLHTDVFLVLLMIFWELLHCLWQDFSPVTFVANVLPLGVLALVMSTDMSGVDFPFIARSFAAVTLATFLTLVTRVIYFSGFDIARAVSGLQRLGMDARSVSGTSLAGGQINPNTLGVIGVLAISGLMHLVLRKQGRKSDLLVSGALVVCGALTASRTYLVCLVFMAGLLVVCREGTVVQKTKFLGKVAGFGLVALLVMYILFPDLLIYYIGRFFVRDITTGRDMLMVLYHEFIMSNLHVLLLGIGMQNYKTKLTVDYRVYVNVPHNSVQELVIAWGLPGIVMIGALIWFMFRSSRRSRNYDRLLGAIPLLVLLLKSLAGQLLCSSYTMLAFSYAFISMSWNYRKKEQQL